MPAIDRTSSELARLIDEKDWSQTPLGEPAHWPPALRITVSLILASRFPQLLWWGPEYIQIYNDAYRPIPGAKHPKSLGQKASECWPEIWHILKPLIDTPFNAGPPTWIEDFELEIRRSTITEETHFTVAYSPVPDETVPSGIGGVLATVHEITSKVIGERRLALLRELAARATEGRTAEDACLIAAECLGKYPKDLPFSILYLLDPDRKHAQRVSAAGVDENHPSCPGSIDLSQESAGPWTPFGLLAVRQNSIAVVENLQSRLPDVPPGPWSDPPATAVIVPIPSGKTGDVRGFVIHGVSARLSFDDNYRTFFLLISAQIAIAISNAEAYEQERRRAEALAEIDRAKTVFFSNVSHEFRTPLTLMLGPLQDLLSRSDSELAPTAREQLELANRNGARLLRLVNTLLDFSRIEAGRVQAVYEPTDLCSFTAELASVFRSATEKAGLQLTVNCHDLGEPVYVDRDMWEKIVLNLISNAFKFTFDGEIIITMQRVNDFAELRVHDTGVGIPQEALPKIFERFHRVPNTRSRTHEGSGIGLALVQELVKLHGGSIRAESSVDQGTTFTVNVPFGQAHVPQGRLGSRTLSSTVTGAMPFVEEALRWLPNSSDTLDVSDRDDLLPVRHPGTSGPRARVLVADDNSDMRHYLARLLSEQYEVETVSDGRAAMARARENPPNLILSDIMMPELDGFALVKVLRADEKTRNTPIVLLSARAGEESRVEGMQAGADDYLVKPFSARELLARIAARLEIARLQQKTQSQLRAQQADLERKVQERTRDLSSASQQLRELSARILQAQDEERRRLARELHDGVGQLLAAASMEIANVIAGSGHLTPDGESSLANLQTLITQVNQDIRTMSYLLYPPLLDEVGLRSALTEYVHGFTQRSRIQVSLDVPPQLARLERGLELCLFRIVQECLTNIHRHSESKTAGIRIACDNEVLTLQVRDQGRGISSEKLSDIQAAGSGVGIRGMRERVRHFGGEISFKSDGSGTAVCVTVPISGTAAQPSGTTTAQAVA
ncbi:MAG TPA: ATP-binding protein [Candidatus Sulfotelmatobacter sp.]|nr:ATP-binding protein [Candidatus Sulfotelmatobacter sp.]